MTTLPMIDIPSRPPLRRTGDTSRELVEVRTIHTRAVSALNRLHRIAAANRVSNVDPEIREMIDSLHKVELLLAPWARKNLKIPTPLVALPSREEILGTFVKGK